MRTHLDLFSGIGGFALAAQWAGYETVLFCDNDPYCQVVLRKHWPDVPIINDIREVTSETVANAYRQRFANTRERHDTPCLARCKNQSAEVRHSDTTATFPTIDLLTGGFPCQPFSVAGKRGGTSDDRYLWPEMLRVISEVMPTWVLAENVGGLVSLDNGLVFERVLSDLEGISYEVQPLVIPACAVNAPHRRDRVWIVGHATGSGRSTGGSNQQGRPVCDAGIGTATENQQEWSGWQLWTSAGSGREDVADTDGKGREGQWPKHKLPTRSGQGATGRSSERDGWNQWAVEPNVGRRLDGFPIWLDRHCGRGLSYAESKRRSAVLRELWDADVSTALWQATRGLGRIQAAEVLFAFVREYEANPDEARLLVARSEVPEGCLRGVRGNEGTTSTPSGPEDREQLAGERTDAMQTLSRVLARDLQEDWSLSSWEDGLPRVATGVKRRVDRLRCLGNAIVPAAAFQILKRIREIDG